MERKTGKTIMDFIKFSSFGALLMERGTSKRRQRLDQRFPPTHIVRLTGKEIPGASENISTAFLRLLAVFLQNFNRISTIVRLVKVTRGSTIVLHPYTNCDSMK